MRRRVDRGSRASAARARFRRRLGVRAGARVAATRQARAALRPLHRRQVASRRSRGKYFETINPATEQIARRGRRGRAPHDVDAAVQGRARGATTSLVEAARRRSAASTSSASRALHPGEGARARHRRDDGRRQADQGVARRRRAARRGALLLPRGLGRQARLRVPGPQGRGRSASPGRSSRGTSRCSWRRGRSRRRSPAATPSCSSPPRRRRSRRCSSRRSSRRRSCRPAW